MQLTINIDSSNLGSTVEEVFQSLSTEERKGLAKDIMLEVLTKPINSERELFATKTAEAIYAEDQKRSYHSFKNVTEARQSSEMHRRMKDFESTQERMIKLITQEATKHFQELVTDMVKNDEGLKSVYAEVQASIVANYPAMVQSAMTHYLASQMQSIGLAVQAAENVKINTGYVLTDLTNRLANKGITL